MHPPPKNKKDAPFFDSTSCEVFINSRFEVDVTLS